MARKYRRTKTNKIWLVHYTSVRAYLVKRGFKVGSWASSSRVSGWGTFCGGNISIDTEYLRQDLDKATESCHYYDAYYTSKVSKSNSGLHYGEVDLKELRAVLEEKYYVVVKKPSYGGEEFALYNSKEEAKEYEW